jgi:heme o synthase
VTAAAGFFLASRGQIDWWLLVATIGGLSLVVASACVYNNYLDQDIDRLMARTKKRALASGQISDPIALTYATVLGLFGGLLLAAYTNILSLSAALIGLFVYVVIYSFFKRYTSWGTVIGSIAGAVSPVVGYLAVRDHIDSGAIILFFILVLWQMPHFYAIAIYRLKEYKSARIPVLPIKKSVRTTKIQILLYILAFTIVSLMLTAFNYASYGYLVVAASLGLYWFWLGAKGFGSANDNLWAKKMFRFSLVVITLLSVTISIDSFIY